MASSRVSTAVLWSAVSSQTLSTNAVFVADQFIYNAEDWQASLQVNADNATNAAAGDIVNVWVAYTAGDVLGDSGNDYDTNEHATFLGSLNTYGTDIPGEDPARATFPLDCAPLGFKLLTQAPNGASRNIAVRAMVVTHRPQ